MHAGDRLQFDALFRQVCAEEAGLPQEATATALRLGEFRAGQV
jgi:hypothetical protein